jgi:hypothetical protein
MKYRLVQKAFPFMIRAFVFPASAVQPAAVTKAGMFFSPGPMPRFWPKLSKWDILSLWKPAAAGFPPGKRPNGFH